MKRTVLILLLTLSCAWPLLAQGKNDPKQTKCTLPIERAPELRGLRLGAPQAGVLSRFPGTLGAKTRSVRDLAITIHRRRYSRILKRVAESRQSRTARHGFRTR